MVSFANRLRQVVAANFVEISRPSTSDGKEAPKPEEITPDSPPSEPAAVEAPQSAAEASVAQASAPQEKDNETVEAVGLAEAAPEPELFAEEKTAAVGESVRSDPMALLNGDGGVDFTQVFVRAEVPSSASFTAEQALSMLHSMPSDLPLRIKRLTVKATLDAVGQAVGATPTDIVDDAGRKIDALESFIRDTSDRAQQLRDAEDAEIARLRVKIAEREAAKATVSLQEERMFRSCREKIADLDQVVAFFTTGESEAAAEIAEEPMEMEDTDELPAYLQEDAVKRLLGLHGGSSEEDRETFPSETDTVGTKSRTSRSRR